MAEFVGMRGTSYANVAADDVIAPPYDVVNATERARLAALSRYNAILVELPEASGDLDRYGNAAAIFARWHAEAAVVVADEPSLYVYRMSFEDEDGSERATTGVLGALKLDPSHEGNVLPHEMTTSKDKSDRLSLLRAARTNFSPIWGLTVSPGLAEACSAAAANLEIAGGSSWRGVDDEGVTHEVWVVSDPARVASISAVVAAEPVLIADGHHRYETACAYFEEKPEAPGTGHVLAFIVELAPEQLSVRAIHRLLGGIDPEALPQRLSAHFGVVAGPADPIELGAMLVAEDSLGLITPFGNWFLQPLPHLVEAAGDDLDSSRLAFALAALGIDDVRYQHGVADVANAVADGDAAAAVLLRPVTVDQIAATAHGGKRMPPKSTFFHPKPRTGMVFRELDQS